VKQLHHHFDNQFDHSSFKSDFGINLEAVHGFFGQLEYISELAMVGTDVLCRLIYLRYHKIQEWEVKKGTYTKEDSQGGKY
jgi:hypothetical protein